MINVGRPVGITVVGVEWWTAASPQSARQFRAVCGVIAYAVAL